MYSKDTEEFFINLTPQKEQELMQYIEKLKEEISWKYVRVIIDFGERKYLREIKPLVDKGFCHVSHALA